MNGACVLDRTRHLPALGVVATTQTRFTEVRLVEERARLRELPATRLPAFTKYDATVRKWSTIHFGRHIDSVPSRLIGCVVEVRQHPDVVEVFQRGKLAAAMPRLRGDEAYRIDYRHVIW